MREGTPRGEEGMGRGPDQGTAAWQAMLGTGALEEATRSQVLSRGML